MTATYRYEDNAEQVQRMSFVCRGCGLAYTNEHSARYCCCTDMPCPECAGRMQRSQCICDSCFRAKRDAKWIAKPAVEWDGLFPLALWDSDVFWFDEDSLLEFVEERECGWDGLKITDCKPDRLPHFDVSEFLCDYCDEWDGAGTAEADLNILVNGWIADHAPKMFVPTGRRLDIESIKRQLGVQP